MARKISRVIMTIIGAALGPAIVALVNGMLEYFGVMGIHDAFQKWAVILIYVAMGLITAIITIVFSPMLIDSFVKTIRRAEGGLADMTLPEIFFGVVGLLVGLIIAFLGSTLTLGLTFTWLKFVISAVLYITFGYLGWSVVTKRKGEINVPSWFKRSKDKTLAKDGAMARPKILDTSVIIDGRIADICRTGIVEGMLIVPAFVLQELRHIADSTDGLKRNRGRRGLDILNAMQEELPVPIKVIDTDYDDISEVDAKLIKLAYDLGGVVVTNDYNLNKVAGVQRVPVLNINELANAIKPVVLPGEEMRAMIMKEGKEAGQGVAYLDDGTMIVVDGGRKYVGETVDTVVTSVLQTSAGRMVFARIK
ncbi:MAG: PIN/TRAM domain-containing protein [Clostridia bacterium]